MDSTRRDQSSSFHDGHIWSGVMNRHRVYDENDTCHIEEKENSDTKSVDGDGVLLCLGCCVKSDRLGMQRWRNLRVCGPDPPIL